MVKPQVKKGRGKPGPDLPPIPDMRSNEWIFDDIRKALEGKDFESMEDANAFLQAKLASGDFSQKKKTGTAPLEKAQDIMYDAWDAKGKERIDLAYKALEVSKDCADAYVLLSHEAAASPEEAIQFLVEGVAAGERALGQKMFEEEAGNFWWILETRPYMRARFDLAHLLCIDGKRSEGIAHMQELLLLNPGDNQGVRHELAGCLLEEGDIEALQKLLDEYPDEYSAVWFYSRALMKFRQEGRTPEADACLVEAFEQNRFVPLYLLGKKKFPARTPEYMSIGDDNEAVVYAGDNAQAWINSQGALMWMRLIHATFRRKPAGKKTRSWSHMSH
jgi:tetratricopeptide (TPR) repeat protein